MTGTEYEKSASLWTVLDADGAFSPSWLQGKSVAPVPTGMHIDAALTRRITAGCRSAGASHLLGASLSETPGTTTGTASRLFSPADREGISPPFLLCAPDLLGAVLYPAPGYALIAGDSAFMTAAVSEGVDTARARFGRYARSLSERHPSLLVVATAHPPAHRAWSHPADVDPASAAARQLALLDALTEGSCTVSHFAHGWWDARRASQTNDERVQGALGTLFDQVFMLLEDYSVDPDLAEPGDLDDAALRSAVRAAWGAFRRAERSPGR
ncbi:hypothetical protein ACWG5P_07130 [Streptomyces prasinus]